MASFKTNSELVCSSSVYSIKNGRDLLNQQPTRLYFEWIISHILIPDLIYRPFFTFTCIEPVGGVEYESWARSYGFITMYHPWWYDHHLRGIVPCKNDLSCLVGRGVWAIVPQYDLEITWSNEAKYVGLFVVCMWATHYPWIGNGDIGHLRVDIWAEFVMSKEFAKPSAFIQILG